MSKNNAIKVAGKLLPIPLATLNKALNAPESEKASYPHKTKNKKIVIL